MRPKSTIDPVLSAAADIRAAIKKESDKTYEDKCDATSVRLPVSVDGRGA